MSLDELLRDMQDGEPRAEQQLFRRLRIELLPFFHKRVDISEVEDITQDTLAIILRALQTTRFEPKGPASFRSFAFVVANYRLWTHHKTVRRRRRGLPSVDSWWVGLGAGSERSPDEVTLSQQRVALVQVAMAAIKTSYRRALESRLRDQDPQAFADAEGIELGTVRSRICRALALLSAEIEARRQTAAT